MQSRYVAIVLAAGAVLALSVPANAGQDLPRTPWGAPDLQGIWNNSTTTPLEQLTDEERAQGRAAQRPVIEATRGTGAAFPEQRGPLDHPSLIVDPPNGRMSMTPQAVQRLIARENARSGRGESDSWLDRNSWERCLTRTLPVAMIPNLYNANYQIFQTPDYLVLVMEMIHEARIIPLDGRARRKRLLGGVIERIRLHDDAVILMPLQPRSCDDAFHAREHELVFDGGLQPTNLAGAPDRIDLPRERDPTCGARLRAALPAKTGAQCFRARVELTRDGRSRARLRDKRFGQRDLEGVIRFVTAILSLGVLRAFTLAGFCGCFGLVRLG